MLESAIEFVKIRVPSAVMWSMSTEGAWREHVNYLFRSKVKEMVISDIAGKNSKKPSRDPVLYYEQELRNRAWELMSFGDERDANPKPLDFATAMENARKDSDHRREHFIEKFTMETSTRREPKAPSQEAAIKKTVQAAAAKALASVKVVEGKDGSKGKKNTDKKEQGKGTGKTVRGVFTLTKKGNKPICFAFNNEGCTAIKGSRVHACQICLSDDHGAQGHKNE